MNPTTDPNSDPNTTPPRTWPAKRILKLIKQEEGSLRLMAKRLDVSPSHFSRVVGGKLVSSKHAGEIALMISAALGRVVRPHEIWPRLYAEDGGAKSTAHRRMPKAS